MPRRKGGTGISFVDVPHVLLAVITGVVCHDPRSCWRSPTRVLFYAVDEPFPLPPVIQKLMTMMLIQQASEYLHQQDFHQVVFAPPPFSFSEIALLETSGVVDVFRSISCRTCNHILDENKPAAQLLKLIRAHVLF